MDKFERGETHEFPFTIETTGGTIVGGAADLDGAVIGAKTMVEEGDSLDLRVWDCDRGYEAARAWVADPESGYPDVRVERFPA